MLKFSRREVQLGALATLFGASLARAETWPSHVVKTVVPFASGGSTDAVTRPMLEGLYKAFGQPFIAENHGGAGSVVGTSMVAAAPADGYTLLSTTASFATTIALRQGGYTLDAFDGVAMLTQSPFMVLVKNDSPVRTVADLVALAKKKGDQMFFATAGVGSSTHFATELFNMRAGIRMQHIPYTGIGPAMIGLLRGDVDVMITTPASAGGQVQDGSIRAIAYTSDKLPPGFPTAPTLKEAGLDYDVTSWWAMLGPHGIPADVLQKLNGKINELLKSEEIIKRYHFIGTEPSPMSQDAFAKLLKSEVAQWIDVAKFANIKAE